MENGCSSVWLLLPIPRADPSPCLASCHPCHTKPECQPVLVLSSECCSQLLPSGKGLTCSNFPPEGREIICKVVPHPPDLTGSCISSHQLFHRPHKFWWRVCRWPGCMVVACSLLGNAAKLSSIPLPSPGSCYPSQEGKQWPLERVQGQNLGNEMKQSLREGGTGTELGTPEGSHLPLQPLSSRSASVGAQQRETNYLHKPPNLI